MIPNGSVISVHYTLTVDGDVIDSSSGNDPLVYTQGEGQIITGLEDRVSRLQPGDKRALEIPPVEGYGEHDPTAVRQVPKDAFQETTKLAIGSVVQGESNGEPFQAVITAVGGSDVTLDFNHPLAGKTLHFDIEVVRIDAPCACC